MANTSGYRTVNGVDIQLWDRNTVADGSKMSKYTIEKICDAIEAGGTDVSALVEQEKIRATGVESAISGKLDTEIERAIGAEYDLDVAITEEFNRATSAENDIKNDLQEQIDLINAATDVINVFGTYSSFSSESGRYFDSAYSATYHLTNNDIIKIINDEYTPIDETGNPTTGHQTYHQWVNYPSVTGDPTTSADGEWHFIGFTEPYYNTVEVDNLLNTAISNVSSTVSENYLSAKNAVHEGKNITVVEDSNNPEITIKTKDDVSFTNVSATNISANSLSATKLSANELSATKLSANELSATTLSAATASGQSAKFDGISATNLTALTASGNSAQYITYSGINIQGESVTSTIDGLINSALSGGAMTGLKNIAGISAENWMKSTTSYIGLGSTADTLDIALSGGIGNWLNLETEQGSDGVHYIKLGAKDLQADIDSRLEIYDFTAWSGSTASLFSGTSRSAQSAGSASLAYSATLADSARIANSAALANSASLANSSTYTYSATSANNSLRLEGKGSADFYPMTGNPSGFITSQEDWLPTIKSASAYASAQGYNAATAWTNNQGYLKTHQSVTNYNPTLAYGQTSNVGKVGTATLQVTMPGANADVFLATYAGSGERGTTYNELTAAYNAGKKIYLVVGGHPTRYGDTYEERLPLKEVLFDSQGIAGFCFTQTIQDISDTNYDALGAYNNFIRTDAGWEQSYVTIPSISEWSNSATTSIYAMAPVPNSDLDKALTGKMFIHGENANNQAFTNILSAGIYPSDAREITTGTELVMSYANNNGFNNTTAPYRPYRRTVNDLYACISSTLTGQKLILDDDYYYLPAPTRMQNWWGTGVKTSASGMSAISSLFYGPHVETNFSSYYNLANEILGSYNYPDRWGIAPVTAQNSYNSWATVDFDVSFKAINFGNVINNPYISTFVLAYHTNEAWLDIPTADSGIIDRQNLTFGRDISSGMYTFGHVTLQGLVPATNQANIRLFIGGCFNNGIQDNKAGEILVSNIRTKISHRVNYKYLPS